MKALKCRLPMLVAFALVACPSAALAQASPKPVPPSGPLVSQPPDYSQIIVTYSYPEERAAKDSGKQLPPDGRTRTLTITKAKDMVSQEYIDGVGGKTECWHVGDNDYSKGVDADSWGVAEKPSKSAGQIPDLGWIASGNYVGTIKYGGRDCLLFVQDAPPNFNPYLALDPKKVESYRYVAYVDKETRLPVEEHAFGVYRYFRMGPTPTGKLTLPADLTKELKTAQEMYERQSHREQPQ